MKKKIGVLLVFSFLLFYSFKYEDWGFYGHREIHYYAVMAMPAPVNFYFKEHVEYLSEHAVDPDQRRYAVPDEGARHFIDLDQWFRDDTLALSRDYSMDRIFFGGWRWKGTTSEYSIRNINLLGDRIRFETDHPFEVDLYGLQQEIREVKQEGRGIISRFLYPDLKEEGHLIFIDSFSGYGILPYYFPLIYSQLVTAMESKNEERILRLCADIGHYVADAHVPLHTTVNYNGQLTGQTGLHAFWESRIPELFAQDHFSAWVGPARYIEDPEEFIWSIILHSHSLVPEVLALEIEAKNRIESNQHYCMEERGSQLVRIQCPELAREYLKLMNGMVERQWASSIHSVASVWYSAWVDAGEPVWWGNGEIVESQKGWWQRVKNWLSRNRSD